MNKKVSIEIGSESVTYPKGFEAAAYDAGIKPGRDDMALIYSDSPAVTAITTTQNKVKAAPVLWDRKIYEKTPLKRAVVINAGNANACTGKQGEKDAEDTAVLAAKLLRLNPDEVYVSSTGVIGVPLPMDKITEGVARLCLSLSDSLDAGERASKAILTTDTKPKTASCEIQIQGKTVRIGAMCKGSGMIRPNMATMLAYTTTDVGIKPEVLSAMMQEIVKDSFNAVSVDGDMSTNDTAIVLANGMSGAMIDSWESEEGELFYNALREVEISLAMQIAKDGEGASKLMEVHVKGAKHKDDARILARSVAESPLVKTAIFGQDANWGRILCALGYADAHMDPERTTLHIASDAGRILLFDAGKPVPFSEESAKDILSESHIQIDCVVGDGEGESIFWGCDLTYDYVKINADYRT